ncbi:MAG: hypothetical protein AB8B69_24005 [Chitinophagales bacterium]
MKYLILICCLLCNILLLKAQNELPPSSEPVRVPASFFQTQSSIEVETQLFATQSAYFLSKKPNIGEAIYFLNTDKEVQGVSTVVSFNFLVKEEWKLGGLFFTNTSIGRNCGQYNDFWKTVHGIDLKDENTAYYYRDDFQCPQENSYLSDTTYNMVGMGISLARKIGKGKVFFEPSVNLGVAWISATEPYLFLKEKNSNNTRSIEYIPENSNFALPSIGFEAKGKWQASHLLGFSASLQYNYRWGTFDYRVEEKELLGTTSISETQFRQSIENFGFGFGMYFSF